MRLLVVEDDRDIAGALQRSLQRAGNAVELSRDGRSALLVTSIHEYDCIVLDLGLPDIDGTQVLRELRHRKLQTPVVILSARDDTGDRVLGLDLGADDYVVKPFEVHELEARIRAVTRRALARRGDDLGAAALRMSLSERRVFVGDVAVDFSPREFSVLECLLLRQGRVVSKRQLLDVIDDRAAEPSESAVELYVHRIRRKIEHSGCSIRTLRGFGYLLQVDEAA